MKHLKNIFLPLLILFINLKSFAVTTYTTTLNFPNRNYVLDVYAFLQYYKIPQVKFLGTQLVPNDPNDPDVTPTSYYCSSVFEVTIGEMAVQAIKRVIKTNKDIYIKTNPYIPISYLLEYVHNENQPTDNCNQAILPNTISFKNVISTYPTQKIFLEDNFYSSDTRLSLFFYGPQGITTNLVKTQNGEWLAYNLKFNDTGIGMLQTAYILDKNKSSVKKSFPQLIPLLRLP